MRLILLILFLLVTFAFKSQTPQLVQDGPVPKGWKNIDLIFSHQKHVVEEELECVDCHEGVEESETGRDDLLPKEELCSDCHDVDDKENCTQCHVDPDNVKTLPPIDTFSPKYSHKQHITEGELECEQCHTGIRDQQIAEITVLPGMLECMDCHEDRKAANECQTCHLPEERIVPRDHTADYIHAHGQIARSERLGAKDEITCLTCHNEDYCQDCHESEDLERFTHPMNYAFTHSLDAQSNEFACATCHTERQFCLECHRDYQVLPHSHTAGWVNSTSGGLHRQEAAADLESCMTCHEHNADIVCSPCHQIAN